MEFYCDKCGRSRICRYPGETPCYCEPPSDMHESEARKIVSAMNSRASLIAANGKRVPNATPTERAALALLVRKTETMQKLRRLCPKCYNPLSTDGMCIIAG
jgi:hypothetical protein